MYDVHDYVYGVHEYELLSSRVLMFDNVASIWITILLRLLNELNDQVKGLTHELK